MRKIAMAVLIGLAFLVTGCDAGRDCIASHYDTQVVLENQFSGIDAKGNAQYRMMPVVKQVFVCDEYAPEEK